MSPGESSQPTRYAVLCPKDGRVYMTDQEYKRQLMQVGEWKCPRCGEAGRVEGEA